MDERSYNTPRETLDYLRNQEHGSPEYEEATKYLYRFAETDVRTDSLDALNAVRHLRDGELDETEELLEDII
jgi:hypothetical protein